jgi:hypothetical protein
MLTLETKVARELSSIEKLKTKLDIRTGNIRRLLNTTKRNPAIETPAPFKKTWGQGRKVPQSVRLEIMSYLKEGLKGHEIKRHFNVSLPTIWKIKDEIGLVKHRHVFGS